MQEGSLQLPPINHTTHFFRVVKLDHADLERRLFTPEELRPFRTCLAHSPSCNPNLTALVVELFQPDEFPLVSALAKGFGEGALAAKNFFGFSPVGVGLIILGCDAHRELLHQIGCALAEAEEQRMREQKPVHLFYKDSTLRAIKDRVCSVPLAA